MKYKIATIGSHTALQILKWAKDEWFNTICVVPPKRTKMYASFGLADEIIKIKNWDDFGEIERILIDENAILVPHWSFVEYLWSERIQKLKCMHFGTKKVLDWEWSREKQREWLEWARLKVPKTFASYEDIDRSCIIKFHGAKWGHNYFIAKSPWEFMQKMEAYGNTEDYAIQEYIVGVPVYAHYFYSPLSEVLEIMSFDKRYESNADSIWRISAKDQIWADINSSYTIVGNIPIVVRESLLPKFWEMGMNVIKVSKSFIWDNGLYGAFCLECIVDSNLSISCFEISTRIVAWTNPFISGSPYTDLRYSVPMSTWRRIAREIKIAIESNRLSEIVET